MNMLSLRGTALACALLLTACGDWVKENYTIGGEVAGLAEGKTVRLALNGSQTLTVSTAGPFVFPEALAAGSSYSVTVTSQPPGQTCSVANGTGTATNNVSKVSVICANDSDDEDQGSGEDYIQIGALTWTPGGAATLQAFTHLTAWPLDTRVRAGSADAPDQAVDLRLYHRPTDTTSANYEFFSYPEANILNSAYLSWETPNGRCLAEYGSVQLTNYGSVGGRVSGTIAIDMAYSDNPDDEDGLCDGLPVTGSFSLTRGADKHYGNDGSGADHVVFERTPQSGSAHPTDTTSFPAVSGYDETSATPHAPLIYAFPRADGGAEIVLETEPASVGGRRRQMRIVIKEPLHSGVTARMHEVYTTASGNQLYCPSSNGAAYFFTGGTGAVLHGEFHGDVDTSVSLFPCPASYVVKFTVRMEAAAP